MAVASCMFIGGAVHPTFVKENERAQQERMYDSVESDIKRMFEFAVLQSSVFEARNGEREYRHCMPVSQVLVNADIKEDLKRNVNYHQHHLGGLSHSLFNRTKVSSYSNKEEVREQVRSYLSHIDGAESLILFMAGHGDQKKPRRLVEESFVIPTQGSSPVEHYTDTELTADILAALPDHKKLYLVIHSCHSGGMVNFWQLDARTKWVALFASAEADILAEWNADGGEGFVDAFCSNATIGEELNTIAESILLDLYSVPKIRPVFKTTRPSIGKEEFLPEYLE